VLVVPPNPGTSASALLRVNGGAEYCVGFGGAAGGQIANKGATSFKVTKPTVQACSRSGGAGRTGWWGVTHDVTPTSRAPHFGSSPA
jgi:hypothetical protein